MNFKGIKCRKCGRKGLHHPDHAHAYGWKEYSKAECRFCHARFRVNESTPKSDSSSKPAVSSADNQKMSTLQADCVV